MKLNRLFLSKLIVSASIITLAACSSSDDDDDNDIDSGADNTPTNTVLFDEADDNDIVNDPNNPQPLQLVSGGNIVNGTVVSPDLDYLTINVPGGSELTAIQLEEYTSADDVSFIGIQAGSVFTESNDNPAVENLLGFVLFGGELEGSDILVEMGLGEGTQGFTPPLGEGDYTFWIQETGDDLVTYSLNFVVEETTN